MLPVSATDTSWLISIGAAIASGDSVAAGVGVYLLATDEGAPAAAFVYLITGERRYADFAWEVFEL